MIADDELPTGWASVSLAELVEPDGPIVYGILQPGPTQPDGVPYIRPTEIENDVIQVGQLRKTSCAIADKYERSALRRGDVVLSIVGTIGKVAVVPEQLEGANITQSSARIRPNEQVLLPKYCAWALRSPALKDQFGLAELGTAVPRLNLADVRKLRVPLAPLNEQERIVAVVEELLSDLDAGVAALERARANLKRYRAAVLKAAVEGDLTADWRAAHPDAEPAEKLLDRILAERRRKWEADQLVKFKASGKTPPKDWQEKYTEPVFNGTADLPFTPLGWCWASIEQLVSSISSGSTAVPQDEPTRWAILRSSSVRPMTVDLDEVRFLSDVVRGQESCLIQDGDLLFVRLSGSREYVAACGLVRNLNGRRLVFPDRLFRAKALDPVVGRYIEVNFASHFVRTCIGHRTKSSAGHQRVSTDAITGQLIPLAPLAEQEAIVGEVEQQLSVVAATEAQIDRDLKRAARLRQAILKEAFAGRLVPQDPADEPASVLLERIRAERPADRISASNGGRRTRRRQSNPGRREV